MQQTVTARNYSESSENRIHSDEIAKKFGFKGALVPGVAVYGYMTRPLVAELGEAWLASSIDSLRLLKPTYDAEQITLTLTAEDDQHVVHCHNSDGELLAVLNSRQPQEFPQAETLADYGNVYKNPERVEIAWDNVTPGQPFIPWEVTITEEMNATYTSQVDDTNTLYRSQFAHPHLLLSLANTALMNEYVMPTWIHVGSETRHRTAVNVGDTLTVKCVTLDSWQKKGHEFINLYVSFWRGEELTADVVHTAIFKVAT